MSLVTLFYANINKVDLIILGKIFVKKGLDLKFIVPIDITKLITMYSVIVLN